MKIKERCKKIGAGILGGIVALTTKVMASDINSIIASAGPILKLQPDYGVPSIRKWENLYRILKIVGIILIPIILIIGLVVYVVKNKKNSKSKESEKE